MAQTPVRTVFISYAREDRSDVNDVVELIRASGADIFLDVSSIDYGSDWQDALFKAIAACERVLVFWSAAAARSDWVTREWRHALSIGKTVVPLPLDAEPLPAELARIHGYYRLPGLLRRSQVLAVHAAPLAAERLPSSARSLTVASAANEAEFRDVAVQFANVLQTEYVVVAACDTVTEAHILRGFLEVNDIGSILFDEHMTQADPFAALLYGRVKVLVPAPLEGRARQILDEREAGAFELRTDDLTLPRSAIAICPKALFSPDVATLWSVVLTPSFAAALHVCNRYLEGRNSVGSWVWLVVTLVLSVTSLVLSGDAGTQAFYNVSLTSLWYAAVGQRESRRLSETYGVVYPKRSQGLGLLILLLGIICLSILLDH